MLIDWFTVGAQALNFIILVWLMKRYFYHPVLDAIAAREKKIATELTDAATTKAKAHKLQSEFENKNKAFELQKAALFEQATKEAKAEGERLRTEAIQDADEAEASRAQAILTDTQHLHAEIVRKTQLQVFDIARHVLDDLADISLERRACAVFIQRLMRSEDKDLVPLSAALKACSKDSPALLRSAFELPEAQQTAIQSALEDTFGQTIALSFLTTPELVGGIELSAQGQKLAWSIADYLKALSLSPSADSNKPDKKAVI
ncbi:F0F1 ATP synthase subunit delta [Celerinatantimonas yamalensis]|uniref:ATP synthase subunit b n=1 Tax=Celerinatantimonas yamalensis TaxID=559956 RepID=A0ABW9G6S7_9GAMM